MNIYQAEFSEYWDKVANNAFYKVVKITENKGFVDKILDNQRNELSMCIREEISRNFFDSRLRPKPTVWLDNLKKDYPAEANEVENYLKNCEISSKLYENIITIATGGTTTVTGVAIRKKYPRVAKLLVLSGLVLTGYRLVSCLKVDTDVLQEEVKKQFEVWKTSMLNILSNCIDLE